PSSLKWVEVDLPDILEYKAAILADAKPRCTLERIPLDLSNADARRGLLADLARKASRAIAITEGLLIYLMPDEVGSLARDLAAHERFDRWIVDVVSPGLLKMMKDEMGELVRQAGAPCLFAPADGPAFFERDGWRVLGVKSLLKTAAA